jgi:F-type H+-transporting ATPase subunit epsilon
MSGDALELEVVVPDGLVLHEDGVDVVVLRRREPRFDRGSEIAVFPLHGPMLVRLAVAPTRYRKGGVTVHLALGGGFAEVLHDRVRVVTPRCERITGSAPDPPASAEAACQAWREHEGSLT